ncbi:unnamed protein product [Rhizopus stolonifer]
MISTSSATNFLWDKSESMASAQNQEKQNGLAEERNLAALGVLEEDDEFEEFAAEGLDELKKIDHIQLD